MRHHSRLFLLTLMLSSAGTAAASTLGSLEGNVTLTAGQHYQQTGSDLIALKGDIAVVAEDIAIREARETNRTAFTQKTKQSGLTISISNPVISAVQTIAEMHKAAADTSDPRMQALAAGSATLAGKTGMDALIAGQGQTVTIEGVTKNNQIVTARNTAGDPTASRDATTADQIGGINLSISLGSSKSKSSSTQTSDTAAGSTLAAAGDITLTATGKEGQPGTGNLLIQGSDLTAGHDLSLTAQNDIELLAAANTQQLRSSNKSSSASIGVSVGTASGFAFTASASQGKGKANGDDLFWSNTHLTAGDTLTLTSGNDTTLRGATASAPQITAHIGGDLKLESLQDTSTYDSKQKSSGFSIAISPVGIPVGGSISGSSSKIASDYRSVTEQTALRAGDGGFDIQVGGNTDLKGAAITSTQSAVDQRKNTFNTAGDLTLSDLHNEATYDAQGGSVTLGTQLNEGKYTPQGTSAGYGEDEGHAESTTYAAITGYAGNSTARTGDPESGIDKIFDANKVQKEIDAQVKITQAFGQQASKAVGDYAKSKMEEAEHLHALGKADEAKAIEDQWGKNGTLRLLAHTVIGGLTGGPGGAAGAAAGTLTAPAVSDALKDAGITGALADTITALASTTVGVVVGGDAGGGAALNEVGNNFLSHQLQARRAELRKKELSGKISAEDLLELRALEQADQRSDELLAKWKADPLSLDEKQKRQLAFYLDIYAVQEGPTKFNQLLGPNAIQTGAFSNYGFPYAGTREAQEAYLKAHPISVWQYLVGVGSDYNNENRSIYENAGSQLRIRGIHQAQADFANTVLLATVRPLTVAYGAYQLGYAGGAIYDGDYTTGITNVALGTLAIYGAYTLRAPVTRTEMTGVKGTEGSSFTLATSDDLAAIRLKYSVPEGNTLAVARTDIPGLEGAVVEGLSPSLRTKAGLPSLDDLYGVDRTIKSPYQNPLFTRHAEEDLFNGLSQKIDSSGLSVTDLAGKTVDVKISNMSGVCNKCTAGLSGSSDLSGVVQQFSNRYPELTVRITAEGGTAMPGRTTILVRGGKIVN